MLLWLANLFATDIRALSALNYITLRSVSPVRFGNGAHALAIGRV